MAEKIYDVVIIGAGPAGEAAVMKAAKSGLHVAVVDQIGKVGGNCTHFGTIPSKALRHSVRHIIQFNTDPMFRDVGEPRWFSFPKMLKRSRKIVDTQVQMRTNLYARNRIDLFFGVARFRDKNTIDVCSCTGVTDTLIADNFVIATGSHPYHPEDVNFNDPRIYDSDSILALDHTPRKMVIYGAGVIGCEYASIFCGLGVKVELVDSRPKLLDFLDDEISDALSYHLRDQGVFIRYSEEYKKVECTDSGVVMHLKSGKKIKSDALLWCNGRSGNVHDLNLEKIGLKPTDRGQLKVDQSYCTEVPHIYAAGDVIGWPSLASAAYDQGRAAATGISTPKDELFVDDVPVGIYTIPEISSVGKNEKELTEAKVPYEVGQAFFKTLARAQISGETVGMLKILFHRDSKKLLGIHCFGYQASEIVHIGQAIMNQKGKANTIEYFLHTTFNYPTMAEAYRVAALNGTHRLF